jgi:L-2-hydroxycarboxylate dehydrogenase (NAD+)
MKTPCPEYPDYPEYHDSVWIPIKLLENYMRDAFISLGVPREDAQICAEVLIESDKRGIDSHGIGRFKTIYYDRIKEGIQFPQTQLEVLKDGPTTAVLDGHHGMGHVIAHRAMKMAIEKAKMLGLGMVTVRNSTHYGIAGYYATMATAKGMIGVTGTNARPSMAPTFGVENMLGTNPLVFGIPTDEDFPFVIDCATSLTQRGKVEVYARVGKNMPPGWVIDSQGQTKTNPVEVLNDLVKGTAALTPLGGIGEDGAGYKGYGYATVIEILSSALQDGGYLKQLLGLKDGKKVPYGLGHFFLAIKVEAFITLPRFKAIAGNILRELRNSKKMPGQERIYTAGEKEHLSYLFRREKGIPVNKELQWEILTVCREQNLMDKYPFQELFK